MLWLSTFTRHILESLSPSGMAVLVHVAFSGVELVLA